MSTNSSTIEQDCQELAHDSVREFPISLIVVSPENNSIYRPVDPEDPEIIALAESIRLFPVFVQDSFNGVEKWFFCFTYFAPLLFPLNFKTLCRDFGLTYPVFDQ